MKMAATVAPPPPPPPPFDHLGRSSLYVGDLHPEVTETDLEHAFSVISPLVSARLCRDRLSNKSLRYAYINFYFPSDAAMAFACLNHTELKGKPIRIMWSQRDPLTRKTGKANVFVKNLHTSVTSARLQEIFCNFGNILSCKVAEENGKSKGFGFVQFDSEESAIDALDALHGTMIEGKKLYVSKFVKKSQRRDGCEEPKFTNLYVKNLDKDLPEGLLRDKFSEHGKVRNVVIMKDDEGKSKGFGFVNFESHEEAKKAMEALNGALFGSQNLYVVKAQKKAEREELLKHTYEEMLNHRTEKLKDLNLYVKNLHISIDDKKLEALFSCFGQVKSARVMRHANGVSKGFGFVSFSSQEEAQKALALSGFFVQGRSLYVGFAQRREERRRQLQIYFAQNQAQSFCTSYLDNLTPQYHTLHYSFPFLPPNPVSPIYSDKSNMYQYLGRNAGALYPLGAQNYQGNFSTYSMGYAMQGQNYGTSKDQKPSRIMHTKRRWITTFSAPSPGEYKNIGEVLHPVIEYHKPGCVAKNPGIYLERSKSDMQKLLNSPPSLAVQVLKAVQVKEANSWPSADGGGAYPAKSAR